MRLQKILAYSSFEEIQALNLAKDVFRYPESFAHLLNECREDGMVRNAETEWRRRDGGFVCVGLHLRLVSQQDSKKAIEGFVEDVTEVRALERQLQQAQKFETIGQLAGGIAHDFNNVLGAVLGWAEIGYDQSREHPQLMPQMEGQRRRRNPKMPILFTSGFSENANNAVAHVPGSHYLQKPYSPTSLASMIREILDVA